MLPGTYLIKKKDSTPLYRASVTVRGRHISLGSFATEELAHRAYLEAGQLLSSPRAFFSLAEDYSRVHAVLPFDKWVVLLNFRDHGVYSKTPIYLQKHYFLYYYNETCHFKFDVDDLFYYSNHKIMKRGSHLFVADYGMQVNILSRYGIKNYAVCGRDYRFVNGDDTDYRYANLEIINRYHGVFQQTRNGKKQYIARIHVNGDLIIGRYAEEAEAAVAYNRAAALLRMRGVRKNFPTNYVESLSEEEYDRLFHTVRLSGRIQNFSLPTE